MTSGLSRERHTAADFPKSFDMSSEPRPSTIKLPPAKLLSRFELRQIGDDRIADYLAKGWSLGIVCRTCKRLIEWTPPELEARFGAKPQLRISELARRLKCSGDQGCGSADIAVFPHLYDGGWQCPAWAK